MVKKIVHEGALEGELEEQEVVLWVIRGGNVRNGYHGQAWTPLMMPSA